MARGTGQQYLPQEREFPYNVISDKTTELDKDKIIALRIQFLGNNQNGGLVAKGQVRNILIDEEEVRLQSQKLICEETIGKRNGT